MLSSRKLLASNNFSLLLLSLKESMNDFYSLMELECSWEQAPLLEEQGDSKSDATNILNMWMLAWLMMVFFICH